MTRHHRPRRLAAIGVLSAVVAAGATTPVAAATAPAPRTCSLTWVAPGDGRWSAAVNWSPARTPRADDDVCLPLTARSTITVVKPDTVRTLAAGNAELALSTGVTLTVGQSLVLDGTGTVHGGAVRAAGVTVPDSASPALRGVAVTTFGVEVYSPLRLTGGATLHGTAGYLFDSSVTGDGDPGELVEFSGNLDTFGVSAVRVPLRARSVQVNDDSAAAFPALIGSRPGGVLDQTLTVAARGSVVLPRPVTTVASGATLTVYSPLSAVTAASTGRPALSGLTTVLGSLDLARPATFNGPLAMTRGSLDVRAGATVTAPAMSVSNGGRVTIDRRAAVRLGADGTGVFTEDGDQRTRLDLDGTLDGDLDQGDSGVAHSPLVAGPGEVHGDWTNTRNSHLTFSSTGRTSDAATPTNLVVSGAVTLRGTINLNVYRGDFAPGYREVLLTAAGGLTVDPTATFTASQPRWHLAVESNSIVATFGTAAEAPVGSTTS